MSLLCVIHTDKNIYVYICVWNTVLVTLWNIIFIYVKNGY